MKVTNVLHFCLGILRIECAAKIGVTNLGGLGKSCRYNESHEAAVSRS